MAPRSSLPSTEGFALTARGLALPVAVSMTAALAGMATALAGSLAGYRALYYVAVFALIIVAGMVAMTLRDPLRFSFLALLVCFPIAAAEMPPGAPGVA